MIGKTIRDNSELAIRETMWLAATTVQKHTFFSKNDKIAYFVNLCSVCDASNLGKERYYNLGQKKKKKKELGTPSTKVIVYKSCGDLSLLK